MSSKPRRSLVGGQARRDRRQKKDGSGRTTTSRGLATGADLLKDVNKDANGFDDLDEVFGDLSSDDDAGEVLELTMDTTVNNTMESTPAPPETPGGRMFSPSVAGSVSTERRSSRKRKDASPLSVSKFPGGNDDDFCDFQDGEDNNWEEPEEEVAASAKAVSPKKPASPKKKREGGKSGPRGKGVGRKTMMIVQEGGFLPGKEDYQDGRKSKRTKFAPKQWWANERQIYERFAKCGSLFALNFQTSINKQEGVWSRCVASCGEIYVGRNRGRAFKRY